MALAPGSRLGAYEVLSAVRAGGMGEVYRARDTRLGREVAIKVLPAEWVEDERRGRRLLHEARVLSTLNHPHIVTVHEIESDHGRDFIVMELVDGTSLEMVIPEHGLPLPDVLQLAIPIADGLAAAHAHGIVHGDLKPANVMLRRDGTIKVLDFGLARLADADFDGPPDTASDIRALPAGRIAGTAAYMAPEQASGGRVDARSDIFSFGSMLYEMATGTRPFEAATTSETLAAVVRAEAAPPSQVAPGLPRELERLILRCLRRELDRRYQSMLDVRNELQEIKEDGQSPPPPGNATSAAVAVPEELVKFRRLHALVPWLLLVGTLLAAAVAVPWLASRREEAPPRLMRFEITPPAGSAIVHPGTAGVSWVSSVVAPDGHAVVVVMATDDRRQLYLRSLDSTRLAKLAGTDGASNPFWSPDSRWIAFFQGGTLKKIKPGSEPQTVCDVAHGAQGAWGAEDIIVMTSGNDILRVDAKGGRPTRLAALPEREVAFWPAFLPDGRHFLYLHHRLRPELPRSPNNPNSGELHVRSVEPGSDETRLLAAASRAVYASPGYLLYVREGTLLAQPFDAERLRFVGEAASIADDLLYFAPLGFADLSSSTTGVLVYQVAASASRFVWYSREGTEGKPATTEGVYEPWFRLSPDGKRLAMTVVDRRTRNSNVWVMDLERKTQSRLTFDVGVEVAPLWSPDGQRLAFSADRGAPPFLHVKRLGTEGSGEAIAPPTQSPQIGADWANTPDGEFILYGRLSSERGTAIFSLALSGDRTPRPWVDSPLNEGEARFAPGGRWVAYGSDESGRQEVYVRPFAGGERRQISTSGGSKPRWNGDGRELFFVGSDGRLMSVPVGLSATIETGVPRALFSISTNDEEYEVTPDGKRFLVQRRGPPSRLAVVLNWQASLHAVR
jgi:Tol biopolymer transport system component